MQSGEAGHQRLAIELLELVKFRTVHQTRDNLAHVKGLSRINGDHAAQLPGIKTRFARLFEENLFGFDGVETRHDPARDLQRVIIIRGVMIHHAGFARVHIRAAEILRRDHFAGRGLHQRRAAQENGALLAHDHGFIGHGRHIGAACGAAAHHHSDLRDAFRRQIGLIEEDATKMLLVRKHFGLVRQVRAS